MAEGGKQVLKELFGRRLRADEEAACVACATERRHRPRRRRRRWRGQPAKRLRRKAAMPVLWDPLADPASGWKASFQNSISDFFFRIFVFRKKSEKKSERVESFQFFFLYFLKSS